jgi:hypothetical protein
MENLNLESLIDQKTISEQKTRKKHNVYSTNLN